MSGWEGEGGAECECELGAVGVLTRGACPKCKEQSAADSFLPHSRSFARTYHGLGCVEEGMPGGSAPAELVPGFQVSSVTVWLVGGGHRQEASLQHPGGAGTAASHPPSTPGPPSFPSVLLLCLPMRRWATPSITAPLPSLLTRPQDHEHSRYLYTFNAKDQPTLVMWRQADGKASGMLTRARRWVCCALRVCWALLREGCSGETEAS